MTRFTQLTCCFFGVFVLVAVAGCDESHRPSCVRSTDCPGTDQCINGLCYAEGTDASVGTTPCDECIDGWICSGARCVPGCGLTGCAPGLNCDPSTNECVSTPVCLAAENCMTDTDDDCDDLVGCADPDCSGASCDDGIWCNGADMCTSGMCENVGPAACEGACDEAMDSCGECTVDMDCGADEVGPWSMCSYGGACAASGTRMRTVTRHQCVSGMCMTTNMDETDAAGCARNTEGVSCGGGRCFSGSCTTRCGTENNGDVNCSTLCAWCGGSCSAAEISSSGAIESCGFRRSGVNMWCWCTGI